MQKVTFFIGRSPKINLNEAFPELETTLMHGITTAKYDIQAKRAFSIHVQQITLIMQSLRWR